MNEDALVGWVQLACDQLVQACSSDVSELFLMQMLCLLLLC